jgi:hypothetical protein
MKFILRLIEEADRNVSIIKFSFPKELSGYSDIHSQNQLNGVLNIFGRGIVDSNKNVKLGNIGSSHVGLSKGSSDAKRFYFGYNKALKTVYVVTKNSMDDSFIRNPEILKIILSYIFDGFRLSITQGVKLKFIEYKGRPKIPGILLLKRINRIDDIKEPVTKKTKLKKRIRSTSCKT